MSQRQDDLGSGVRDLLIDTPRGRLFTRAWGERHCWKALAPIVLIHDSLGSVDLWRDFPSRLTASTGHPVIAYDRLGFGRSDEQRGKLETPGFVRHEALTSLPALRSTLDIDRMILFGHSVGGAMALVAAAELGDEIVGVITEAAQVFVEARTLAGIRAAKEAFAAPGQIDRLARHHGAKARWVLDAWTESWLAPAFANWTIDADLRRIRCPILAMHGDRDDYGSRAHPERIAALAPTAADIVWLSECGHVPHREQTDAVLTAIQTFIANRVTSR